jgi:hypothetical protein
MASSAERPLGGANMVDVLDHVLDKGIVIDAWARVSLVGVDLLTVEARVLVASIETYLQHARAVAQVDGFAAGLHAAISSGSRFAIDSGSRMRPKMRKPPK